MSDYKGRWVLINFWAEWCAPCLEEIPELNLLHLKEVELNLAVIAISYEPLSNNELKQQVNKWNMQYPVVATEPMPLFEFNLPATLPTNFIIDPKGKIVAKLAGKQTAQSLSHALNEAKKTYSNNP